MIKILQSWTEVGAAIGYLANIGLDKKTRVYHSTPIKNWDLAQIARLLQHYPKTIKILDMGCGGSSVLRFCYKNGFVNTYGIDIVINFSDRWRQLMYWKNNGFKLPYYLQAQNITETNFENNFFDVMICLSVIEHHVNLTEFVSEASRILKTGGLLYVSTDYHDAKLKTFDAPLNYESQAGEWNIFSKAEIVRLILLAKKYRLHLRKEEIPKMKQAIINWNTKKYTFLSMVFYKSA